MSHLGSPIDSMSESRRAKRNEVSPRRRPISSTMRLYSGESVVAYSVSFLFSSPSNSLIMRQVISSRSLFDDVKPMNGQPYTSGGHEIRT